MKRNVLKTFKRKRRFVGTATKDTAARVFRNRWFPAV